IRRTRRIQNPTNRPPARFDPNSALDLVLHRLLRFTLTNRRVREWRVPRARKSPSAAWTLEPSQIVRFRKSLLAWFHHEKRELPWRKTNDPYRIWVSEIMLQQTRVVAVIPYYEKFLERFPNVRALANARTESVLQFWAGLGYYSRARNLHAAAKEI